MIHHFWQVAWVQMMVPAAAVVAAALQCPRLSSSSSYQSVDIDRKEMIKLGEIGL